MDDINLRPIFQKLGHTLEEIRVRALQNLLSKLEHNLICDADLVQEKHMHIRLLEWFNFPSCPLQERCLSLIARMCKHPPAAKIYVDVGAIEFLTQFKQNVKEPLNDLIDGILDTLYHIPDGQEMHTADCIVYIQQPDAKGNFTAHSIPRELLEISNGPTQTPQQTQEQPGFQKYPSPPDQQGYFGETSADIGRQYSRPIVPAATANCFKFSTFPWIPLTPTDRHVLTSTDTSLRNDDPSLVASAGEFLSDVVFQDFPAEVFLQRPNIVKSLLTLLTLPMADRSNIALNATRTLHELTSCLESRIYYHQDPALYTPKQDFQPTASSNTSAASFLSHSLGSSDSRPSALGHGERQGGDGQDGDNSSTSAGSQPVVDGDLIEQTDIEDIQSLQFMQWTTPQYCFAIIEKVLPCMKTPDEAFLLEALDLLHQILMLLKESLAAIALWEDNSVPARDVIDKFHDSLEMLGDILFLHHHSNLSSMTPVKEMNQHRVAFIGISVFIVQYIKTMVPNNKFAEGIPKECSALFTMIAFDEALNYSFPQLRESILECLEVIDIDSFNTFNHADTICQSLISTCAFLMDSEELTDNKVLTLLGHAEDGMRSLIYHLNLKFVDSCIKLASYICRKTSPNPTAVQQSRDIILSLLAHPLPSVRTRAYTTTLRIVKDAMGVEHVTEPTTTATLAMVFVIDHSILYQVCCFGMGDSEVKVCKLAEELVICLLQSQLLLSAPRWQQLLEAVTAILPVLQGYANLESTLGKLLIGLLDTESHLETGLLPVSERFRGTLRLLFSKHPRVRSDGLGRLAWFLANEEESMRKLPQFSQLNVDNIANMMMVEAPRSLLDEDTSRSVFQVDGLRKVFGIFVSDVIEISVRKSAADQLGIILQDPCLHKPFIELGGIGKVLEYISLGVRKPSEDRQQPPMTSLLPAMVKMLRCVVQHDLGIRHRLAHQPPLYYMVLRCGLLHHKDPHARQEVSELMAFLLFDEVSAVHNWSEDDSLASESAGRHFSLPNFVVKRYSLPFTPHTHHSLSPHRGCLPPESDPLSSGTLSEKLRFTWNVAWCGGVAQAINYRDDSEDEQFSSLLNLGDVELGLLEASYLPYALQRCVHDMENATGHKSVSKSVVRLTFYISAAGPHDINPELHCLKWRETVSRFFLVIPSSNADEQLLADILSLVYHMLKTSNLPSMEIMTWIGNVFHNHKGALLGLMSRAEGSADELPEETLLVRRQLNKQLLKTVEMYVGKYPYSLVDRTSYECVRGDLSLSVLSRINRNNAAHFYNLASLESTLKCLMHITARPGWSLECRDADALTLCQQTLTSLLEVVSAFHIGRGGMSMSYMGRGITRCASVCLRHLAFEMATQLHSKDWPRNWLFSRQATQDTVGESGLHWLIPLWHYRDTEVRAAGVGIAAALASTEAGRITMTTQCQQMPGGIWGGAFSVLLDQSECSLVRQQAALLLVNMTSLTMPSSSVESAAHVWQGPIIRNEETQVSLVGLSALLALLHHSRFYPEMMVLLSNFYPQPAIHPISVAGSSIGATPLGSQMTITTSGSASPGRMSRLAEMSSSSQILTSTPASERPALEGQNGNTLLSVPSSTGLRLTGRSISSQGEDRVSPLSGRMTTSQGVGTDELSKDDAPGDSSTSNQPQLPTDNGANMSGSGSSHGSGPDFPSVSTPCLVSAVCQLISNLVSLAPQDTLTSINNENMHKILISILDVNLLDAYVDELRTTEYRRQYLLAFQDLLRLHVEILNTICRCIVKDPNIRSQLLKDMNALKQVAKLLGISYQDDPDTAELCGSLWEAVFSLLSALLQVSGQEALTEMSSTCVKQWSIIAGRTVSILQDKAHIETDLWLSTLHFVALLLTEEGKRQAKGGAGDEKTVKDRLDNPVTNEDGDLFQNSSGTLICQGLVRNYDSVVLKPLEQNYAIKLAVTNALKSLLTLSVSAKMAALEAGLVETICEHIKHLTMKLNMAALELGKPSPTKKKDNPVITEMVLTCDMLRNFMYNSAEIKLAAYECGLSNLVHKVWAWCLMESNLMVCVLSMLATYTARCPQAASSLAFTSAMSLVDKPNKAQHSSTSLVHCIIKLIQREMSSSNLQLLKASYSVLATISLSQECMGILWKSNFLHDFSNLSPSKPKKSKAQRAAEGLWLDLLVNLSFSTEGQNMILKLDDSIGLLLEFGLNGNEHHQKCATLILRNLCFHTSNKPKLLANDKLLPFLLRSLEVGSSSVKGIVCSALVALVYNSQKAKGCVKNGHVMRKLQDAHNHFVNMTPEPWTENCAKNLQDVLTLIKN